MFFDADANEMSASLLILTAAGFVPPVLRVGPSPLASHRMDLTPSGDASLLDKAKIGFEKFQASRSEGYGVKQAITDAIAGEFDASAVSAQVKADANSAPLVLFTWDSSPACKKALKLLALTGANFTVVKLDAPWDEGNQKRSVLGRLTGKSSVPSVWIGGKYVGGCDDGPSDDAPGLVPLAFQGKLLPMLTEAGAL